MKIFRENIVTRDKPLVLKEEHLKYNDFPLHFHPEFEIILILEGCGRRIVGDSITEFSAVDLCMFGSNLPHTYNTKALSDNEAVHQFVIQFHENCLGHKFFDRPSFTTIRDLLQRSSQGIAFTGNTKLLISKKIQALATAGFTATVIGLLDILHLLSLSDEYTLLSSPLFYDNLTLRESSRMSKVYDYILTNFKRDLSLEEVASIAHLSPAAFCRYFKKLTRKTLSEFLVELRLGYACKLLQNNSMSICLISAEAGFNNVSYFNRKFKTVKGETPMQYQRHFLTR